METPEVIEKSKEAVNNAVSNADNTGKIVGALLIGAAVGAALGLLFAPGKGSETREALYKGAHDFADDAKDTLKAEIGSLRTKIMKGEKEAERKFDDLVEAIKDKFSQFAKEKAKL